jgi:glycosyltransferase involved in cell wall biosynthesis
MTVQQVAEYIQDEIKPDVLHLHGNHSWNSYPYYAKWLRPKVDELIFSPAGSSCGTPEFISLFDHVIVNHSLQVKRIKCQESDREKIIVRRRAVNLDFFKPAYQDLKYDFVYIAGFVPVKQIPAMIEMVVSSYIDKNIAIVGDISRTHIHYSEIVDFIKINGFEKRVNIIPFMSQKDLVRFLGECGIFVWPNIKPENPETTTNRSVVEALGCGLPLLLGERAFRNTEFVVNDKNGFTYNGYNSFHDFADWIFLNLDSFREKSLLLAEERFSYQRNFIDFYNKLYGI